ncbi:MAG: hypothetical protein O3C04_04370 [Crenarchaeota archaeon]|nr:hypothetical protein [Thermoproteota archaeon]
MRSYPVLVFSLTLVLSIIFVSNFGTSFADNEVIATSIGFEDSTILELKNNRDNTANINTVRIWMSGDNEFKSFKTEEGWMGKNTPQGVIVFTSQNEVNPGQSVKFGIKIKTTENNPVINWRALDSNGETISSASTTVTISETSQNEALEILRNESKGEQTKSVAIKEKSNFRLIPEMPASNSNFRVVGEGFVPNQLLEFYVSNELQKSVKVDENGRILFTSKVPIIQNDERTEFVLRDSGGTEKSLSIRIVQLENREIAEVIKLSLGNTPQEVKRGETITLEGMSTPHGTITIITKDAKGEILLIDTIQVRFDGKWTYDNLFAPDLELGIVSIEIDDGKNKALRNITVISAKLINITTTETKVDAGDIVVFEGSAIPNQEMSIIIEDSKGTEIISRTILVGESGIVNFNAEIPRGSVKGTYVLLAFQGDESGITIFGVGQEPEEILIVKPTKLNFLSNEEVIVEIQGPVNAQISIILIDSTDKEKFSDTLNLGPDGKEIYKIKSGELSTGSYTMNIGRGTGNTVSAVFAVGLTTGSGAISIQTTRDNYKLGEQILITGNTGAINVLLDITISDAKGTVIKKIETFSDQNGVFKITNFRIPLDGELGKWTVLAKSGGNFKEFKFLVTGVENEFTLVTDRPDYRTNELLTISGSGARMSASISIKIMNSDHIIIEELTITAKSNGEYLTLWQIPADLVIGEYGITADDATSNASTKFTIN